METMGREPHDFLLANRERRRGHRFDTPTTSVTAGNDERREWLGREFDPEAFDPGEFDDNFRNARLAVFQDEV